MAKRTTPQSGASIDNDVIAVINVGNGSAQIVTSDTFVTEKRVIEFEPVIAPLTTGRGIDPNDEKPKFSLVTDGSTLVFGVNDVRSHGKRDFQRRLNAMERYGTEDYKRMFLALLLHGFAARRGGAAITPRIILTVPISIYNDADRVLEIQASLVGDHRIEDSEKCVLDVHITKDSLAIRPESAGAIIHWAYGDDLRPRVGNAPSGRTLVIDVGYLTTNVSVYEGTTYQRDRGLTIAGAGMGILSRGIAAQLSAANRQITDSEVDDALKLIASTQQFDVDTSAELPRFTGKRVISVGGLALNVGEAYDSATEDLASRIADGVLTGYPESATRALIIGGGAYHLYHLLRDKLPFPVGRVPQPEQSDLLGLMKALLLKRGKG